MKYNNLWLSVCLLLAFPFPLFAEAKPQEATIDQNLPSQSNLITISTNRIDSNEFKNGDDMDFLTSVEKRLFYYE